MSREAFHEDDVDDLNDLVPDSKAKRSQADKLVELASNVEFFHADDEPFAVVQFADHHETWPVHAKGFRRWLSREYYLRHEKAASSQATQDALNVLAGRAIHDGAQLAVHTRVAEHGGNLYLDLADPRWRAVEITPSGWTVIDNPPVKFIRTRGMLPIPDPVHGGRLDDLSQFLNIRDDGDFALVKAFLIATLRPNRPFPFLVLSGEQGSGKTSQSIRLKSLIDPSKAPVRGLPREVRDLAIASGNGWLLAFDNVSRIPDWTSDALCSLSTGGGFSTRELYSDSDEKIFDYQRPLILNGIGDIVTRPDLLDRSIILQLPIIPEYRRRQESDLIREFETARPRLLGALLDGVVMALKNAAGIRLERLPRMADFAVWSVAAEPSHSPEAVFLHAYTANRTVLNKTAIDTSVIGPPILQLLSRESPWSGHLTDLLDALNSIVPDSMKRAKSWPSIPRQLKSELERLAPNLRQSGIEITFEKRTNKGIPIRIEQRINRESSTPSPSTPSIPPSTPRNSMNRKGCVDSADSADENAPNLVWEGEL